MAAQTFDNRDGWIWMDGHMVSWRDAKVHVLTHALHYASAVFEGRARLWWAHFQIDGPFHDRLRDSARILDFELPLERRRNRRRQGRSVEAKPSRRRLRPSDCLARLGDDGRGGAAQHDPLRRSPCGSGRAISIPPSG